MQGAMRMSLTGSSRMSWRWLEAWSPAQKLHHSAQIVRIVLPGSS